MAQDSVTVKILDLPGVGSGCACSSTPRGPEYVQSLVQRCSELRDALEASYPGRTTTELIDLSTSPEEKETEAAQLLVTKKFPPPLVVINGEPRFAGSVQVKKILKEVENILTA